MSSSKPNIIITREVSVSGGKKIFLIFTPLDVSKEEEGERGLCGSDLLKTGFSLMLSDGEDWWSGKVSCAELDTLSQDFSGGNHNLFLRLSEQALFGDGEQEVGDDEFEYEMKCQAPGHHHLFLWKLYKPREGVKIVLGKVRLSRYTDRSQCVRVLLCNLMATTQHYQHVIKTLTSRNQSLMLDREKAFNKLSNEVDMKSELERSLFTKFAKVLNSKKKRIRQLEADLSEVDRCQKKARVMSDSEGDDTDHSDEQKKIDMSVSSSDEDVIPRASTSIISGAGDSSFGEGNSEPVIMKRNRRGGGRGRARAKQKPKSVVKESQPSKSTNTRGTRRTQATQGNVDATLILQKEDNESDTLNASDLLEKM